LEKLHIISFANPYPPDYGGAIDVFYKIKALSEAGVPVILHVFLYDRGPSPELLEYCEKVYYYRRKTGWAAQVSLLPYIVNPRRSGQLLENLCKDQYPILFEGLHSCFYLDHPLLKNRRKLVRTHNIEHEYYSLLAKSTINIKNRLFYILESYKLKRFEKTLRFCNRILAISPSDYTYFNQEFGNAVFFPAFHQNQGISSQDGFGTFILMHGNLGVEENESAVLHCLRNVFAFIDFPVVIAGKSPSELLKQEIQIHPNVILVENPDEKEMVRLQHEAHIHICYTFQASGLKLKLLNSLFKGRFVVANPLMTDSSGLGELTFTCKNDTELVSTIKELTLCSFGKDEVEKREVVLRKYRNGENVKVILEQLD